MKLDPVALKTISSYYVILFLLGTVYLLLRRSKFYHLHHLRFPRIYVKEFPFHLNEKAVYRFRLTVQFFLTILATAATGYIILDNLSPLGVTMVYSSGQNQASISPLGPKNRVTATRDNGQPVTLLTNDLVYFTTDMPFNFDSATVTVTYRNPEPDQTISLGFQDQDKWHYETQLLDVPFLNSIHWKKTGTNPVLYQRQYHFSSLDEFLRNPPKTAIIGIYDYDTDLGSSNIQLPNYTPQTSNTVISTPLRGEHTLYVYVHNEPFHMVIQKQDMNWYEDPDVMTVKVYKDRDLVYQATADDDGITDNSKRVRPPQTVTIDNPGPGLPENGVYKVVIDANQDTIIKSITTNLHKIVFGGQIFPVGNHLSYSTLIASTSATTVYTNALALSALTYHTSGEQDIQVDDQVLHLNTLNSDQFITPKNLISTVVIPTNDVILNGYFGYFSFAKDQFFSPTAYHVLPVTKKEDLDMVDYLLTDYTLPSQAGSWQVATHTFDLRSAVVKKGKLSWVIEAPQLQANNRQIMIKQIDVVLHKDSWF